jgi:hypothetical protein
MPDPVRLDPFQNIVNVHWPSGHLAFVMSVKREWEYFPVTFGEHQAFIDACFAAGGPVPPPPGPPNPPWIEVAVGQSFESTHVTQATYSHTDPDNPASQFQVWDRQAETWGPVSPDAVTGLPSLSGVSFSYGAWEVPSEVRIGPPEQQWWPRGRWADPSGSAVEDIPVPGHPDKGFVETTQAIFHLRGNTALSGPFCAVFYSPPHLGSANTHGMLRTNTYDQRFSDYVVDLSGVRVTVGPRTYRAIGVRPIHNEAVDAGTAGVLWVVCKPTSEA